MRGESAFLTGTNFTDDNIDLITQLPNINRLYFENTRVTPAGLRKLKGIPSLKTIYLIGQGVTPKDLEEVRKEMSSVDLKVIP